MLGLLRREVCMQSSIGKENVLFYKNIISHIYILYINSALTTKEYLVLT